MTESLSISCQNVEIVKQPCNTQPPKLQQITTLNNQNLTIPKDFDNKKEEQISYFTKEELLTLFADLPQERPDHMLIFQFLWRTGTRISECLNVRKRDLDFQNQEINIRWLKNRKYQYRKIPLHASLRLPLQTYAAHLNADDVLFDYSRQYVDQLCKQYGFDHAHKLRHSFAVNFLRQSNNPTAFIILQNLLGHSNIQTTMVYLQVVPMQQKEALSKISFD